MNIWDPVEAARQNIRLTVSKTGIQTARRTVAFVGVDPQNLTAHVPRTLLIILRKRAANPAARPLRIDRQRMQYKYLAVIGRIAPVRVRVNVDLTLVDNCGGCDAAICFADIKISAVKRRLRIVPDRVYAGDPADRNASGVF